MHSAVRIVGVHPGHAHPAVEVRRLRIGRSDADIGWHFLANAIHIQLDLRVPVESVGGDHVRIADGRRRCHPIDGGGDQYDGCACSDKHRFFHVFFLLCN